MIDLIAFFGERSFSTPFSAGEFSFASDGMILIRVPRRGDIEERDDAPKLDKLPLGRGSTFAPLRLIPADLSDASAETIKCRDCAGTGKEHDCADCECECEGCSGTGKVKSTPRRRPFDASQRERAYA